MKRCYFAPVPYCMMEALLDTQRVMASVTGEAFDASVFRSKFPETIKQHIRRELEWLKSFRPTLP